MAGGVMVQLAVCLVIGLIGLTVEAGPPRRLASNGAHRQAFLSSSFATPPSSVRSFGPHLSPRSSAVRAAAFPAAPAQTHKLDGRDIRGPLVPLYDRVIVVPKQTEQKSPGGIILSSELQPKMTVAQVVSVGSGYFNQQTGQRIPLEFTSGDWVMYETGDATQKIDYDGQESVVLGARELVAFIKGSREGVATPENVVPLLDTVLLKLSTNEDKTASGLLLSSGEKPGAYSGEVVSVGEGGFDFYGKRVTPEVDVGDHVRLAPYAYRGGEGHGDKVLKFGDQTYVFVRANEILAKW